MAQEYLQRTPTSTGNQQTFTWAGWTKPIKDTDVRQGLFSSDDASGHATLHYQDFKLWWNTASHGYLDTSEFIRDYTAWNHICFQVDSTQQNAQYRVQVWVNGVQLRMDNGNSNISQFDNLSMMKRGHRMYFACQDPGEQFFEGYLMDIYCVDGLALFPEDFGYYNTGKGAENVAHNDRSSAMRSGSWSALPPQTVISNIKEKGGFGTNGGYYPLNFRKHPGLDFKSTPDTILKINSDEQQPRGGLKNDRIEVRDDPYKEFLMLAVPMVKDGLDGGLGDYSHIIRGNGSPRLLDNNGWTINDDIHGLYYGSSGYVNGTGGLDFTIPKIGLEDYCVEFWAKRPTSYGTQAGGSRGFFSLGSVNSDGALTYFIENAGYLMLRGHQGGGSYVNHYHSGQTYIYDTWYPVGQWTHTAITRTKHKGDPTKCDITIYINGSAVIFVDDLVIDDMTFNYVTIGSINNSQSYPFQGYMSDFRLYVGTGKYSGGFVCPKIYTMRQGSLSNNSNLQSSDITNGEDINRVTPDTPENNFAIFDNNIGVGQASGDNTPTHLIGNLYTQFRNQSQSQSTLGMRTGTGKWYAEFMIYGNALAPYIGVNGIHRQGRNHQHYYNQVGWAWMGLGSSKKSYTSTSTSSGSTGTFGSGKILGVEVDTDSGHIKFYENGAFILEFNDLPNINGTNSSTDMPDFLNFVVFRTNDGASPAGSDWSNVTANFGQNPAFAGYDGSNGVFSPAGTYTDANGIGLFNYPVPSGAKALCTKNLPEPATPDPSKYFRAIRYDGNDGASRSIKGLGFKPDLVWLKPRSVNDYWIDFSSVTGAGGALYGNATNALSQQSSIGLKSFDEDGFTLGNWNNINGSGRNYSGYCWKAGGSSGVFNYDDVGYSTKDQFKSGTGIDIGSQGNNVNILGCSIGSKQGLSIVKFTGTAGTADIPHGLGKTPAWIIIKRISSSGNSWAVYHQYVGSQKQLLLNSPNSISTDQNGFDGLPDDKLVHVGSGSAMATNQSGTNIMWAWAEVDGFSRFGVYIGNNNANGPFCYCGFRPAMVIVKRTDSNDHWCTWDTGKSVFNNLSSQVNLNLSDAEINGSNTIYITATGFKHVGPVGSRTNGSGDSGATYIWMAFAECPTKYANTFR